MRILGIIIASNTSQSTRWQTFSEMDMLCENLLVFDPLGYMMDTKSRLKDDFMFNYYPIDIDSEVVSSYNPTHVLLLYDDEIPEKRLRYMLESLCFNEYVGNWSFWIRCLNKIVANEIRLFRWIPEMEYKWNGGIAPENLRGPIEEARIYIDESVG